MNEAILGIPHENLAQVLGLSEHQNLLFFEWVLGDLHNLAQYYVQEHLQLNLSMISHIALSILAGLGHLHSVCFIFICRFEFDDNSTILFIK